MLSFNGKNKPYDIIEIIDINVAFSRKSAGQPIESKQESMGDPEKPSQVPRENENKVSLVK